MRIAALFLILSTQIYAQVLEPKTYSTTGKPTEAMSTPDGQYVLVTVNTGGSSGIDVFHLEGDNLKRTVFQPLGNDGAPLPRRERQCLRLRRLRQQANPAPNHQDRRVPTQPSPPRPTVQRFI